MPGVRKLIERREKEKQSSAALSRSSAGSTPSASRRDQPSVIPSRHSSELPHDSETGGRRKKKSIGCCGFITEGDDDSEIVHEIKNEATFENMRKMKSALVMFYKSSTPLKGFSGKAGSQFKEIADTFDVTVFGSVECGKFKKLCQRENVTSFPEYKLYAKGEETATIS